MSGGDGGKSNPESIQDFAVPLRRSGRRRQAPKVFVPEEFHARVGWQNDEKKRLLEALTRDNGKYDWEALASHVQTKSTDQVRTYVRRIRARAKQGASSRSEDKPPIDEWIALSEKLSKDSTAVKSCLSQIMRLAAVEPLPTMECPTPNYSLIYKYLACLVSGEMVPDLPPTESIVVLDLVRDLMEHLSSCDITPQSAHMRKMYPRLVKKTASSAAHTAMEDDASSSSTQEPIPAEDSDTPRLQPSLSAVLQSFNPFDIPVQLLSPSLKRDDE